MNKQPGSGDEQSRRLVHFTAGRALTSWIRPALSLIALGFVIDCFELVMREVLGGKSAAALHSQEVWRWSGSTLIALGVLMAVVAGIYHLRFALRHHRDGSTGMGQPHGRRAVRPAARRLPHGTARCLDAGAVMGGAVRSVAVIVTLREGTAGREIPKTQPGHPGTGRSPPTAIGRPLPGATCTGGQQAHESCHRQVTGLRRK